MLKVKDLVLLKNGRKVVDEASIDFQKGQITILLGKSGSGKTSLLRCLACVEKPNSGEIIFDSESLLDMPFKQRCKSIGFVPQFFSLFPHLTVLENCIRALIDILRQPKEEAIEKAMDALRKLGMDGFATSYPYELSGGQQQRVAIVRGLLLDSQYFLFDEPTSALDPENTAQLVTLFQKLREEGKGLVIATQDMEFAQIATRPCPPKALPMEGRARHSIAGAPRSVMSARPGDPGEPSLEGFPTGPS